MKKAVLFSAMGALAAWGSAAQAQEVGRVISSTPVVQQVAVPRQVCDNQPMAVQQPNSGGGAVVGAIVGGLLGNTIGHGMGRAAATGVGVVAGAAVGDSIEGRNSYAQPMQRCTTQNIYENRTVAYHVTYEYAGKQYNVQMPNDPGPTIALQVTPSGSQAQSFADGAVGADGPPATIGSAPAGTAVGVIIGQPAVAPVVYPSAYPAYPVYPAYPTYYPRYYPPISLSLGFGFSGGHRHHHRRWR